LFRRLLLIFRVAAAEEQPTVHFRVQRLHTSAQHFGPAREIGNVAHRDSRFSQEAWRFRPSKESRSSAWPAASQIPNIPVLSNTLMSARCDVEYVVEVVEAR